MLKFRRVQKAEGSCSEVFAGFFPISNQSVRLHIGWKKVVRAVREDTILRSSLLQQKFGESFFCCL